MHAHRRSRVAQRTTGLVLGVLCANCEPGAVIRVTSADDDGHGGSLRAAISKANRSRQARVRVEVPSGLYALTRCGVDDTNDNGDLDLTTASAVEIVGIGADVTIRQTCSGERILDARGRGLLSVSNLTLTGGSAAERGGAIQAGAASLNDVTISANRAGAEGGGVYARALTVDDSTFNDNVAALGGAMFAAERAEIRRSTIERNAAMQGRALASTGLLKLSDTAVMNNALVSRITLPLGLPFRAAAQDAVILADVLEANRVTIASSVTTPRTYLELCGYASPEPLTQVYAPIVSQGVQARSVSFVNVTYFDNYGPPPFQWIPCMVHGGGVNASESVTMNHVTFSGSVTTPRLKADRSMLCGATPNVEGSAYNWFGCEFTYPGTYYPPIAPGMTGILADHGGAVPTIVPLFNSPLVDRIPSSDSTEPVDARGVARPQGQSSDIGAVELQYPEGVGPNDLKLEIVSSGAVTAGKDSDVQLLVHNAGPGGARAIVSMQNDAAMLYAGPSSHDGVCTSDYPVSCTIPLLPAGQTAVIPLQWQFAAHVSQVRVDASVTAGLGLQPPFEDDSVSATLPVRVDAALRLEVRGVGREITLAAPNLGPYTALSSVARPVVLSFQPAAGVRVESSRVSAGDWSVRPDDPYQIEFYPGLSFDGVPPAVLGTIRLDPGPNALAGPSEIELHWIDGSDLHVRATRQPGRFSEGEALPVRVTVENHGALASRGGRVALDVSCCGDAIVTWSPSLGSMTTDDNGTPLWLVPDLAPGESALLDGIAITRSGALLVASASASNEADARDNALRIDLNPSPEGTADLQITDVVLRRAAAQDEYVVDVAVMNAGAERYEDVVTIEAGWYPESETISVTPRVAEGNFSCGERTCSSTTRLEVGEGARFTFAIHGRPNRFNLHIGGSGALVDPDYSNNDRFVW